MAPPAVGTSLPDAPVREISSEALRLLGQDLKRLFDQYSSDRQLTELKWLRNLRQYLGIYDPEILTNLAPNRSRAYPRITRVKCISMLARIMNLMFPGNEDNWELKASPSAEMDPNDVKQAVEELRAKYQKDGLGDPGLSFEFVEAAVQMLADKRAAATARLIKDQLQEIGGDQTLDFISLNRKVAMSGIQYGLGVLEGPYVKTERKILWSSTKGGFVPRERTIRKPLYEFLPVWDYYPDMSAKTLGSGDGYFIRKILGRAEFRRLADREDFFTAQVKKYLQMNPKGNYVAKSWETDLKTMGVSANVDTSAARQPNGKFEVIIWKGPVSGQKLSELGVEVPEDKLADDIEAEVWIVDSTVIKADMNAWRKMGVDVRTVHTFVFDEDDTSPIGNGLPNVVRDSQMSVCAAVRMALDNASVVCGPNIEVNESLLVPGQDIDAVEAYKVWRRDDDGISTQYPAVREVKFDSHLDELSKLVEMFMTFADMETFIGPATGGDLEKAPSEPMRTAAGQSMMKGDAALPFKDIVRNYDFFTQSWILSLVHFNRKFNPHLALEGDYDVIARGATSLIAKEVRGIQTDLLAQTLTPEDRDWIDEEKFIRQRMATRDMEGLMVSAEEAQRKRAARQAAMAEISDLEKQGMMAEIRKTLAEAFKNITQGQKNAAGADAQTTNTALAILEMGMNDGTEGPQGSGAGASGASAKGK